MQKGKAKFTIGTAWFLVLLVFAVLGSIPQVTNVVGTWIFWLVLGISGAVVALLNIKVKEELTFIVGTTAVMIIVTAFLLVPRLYDVLGSLGAFLVNLGVGFGLAGLVVALSMIAKTSSK